MRKILLIDDAHSDASILSEELTYAINCEIKWVKNADEVMALLAEEKFDLIVLDIMMPIPTSWTDEDFKKSEWGINTGMVLFQKIREKYPRLFILLYSARSEIQIDEYSFYIRKPELAEKVVNKIKDFI